MTTEDLYVSRQNGITTILHLGFTYAKSTNDDSPCFNCIRPECQGSIIVEPIQNGNGSTTDYKFIKVGKIHNDILLCSRRFIRSRPDPKPAQVQTNALNLTLEQTVYENCIEPNVNTNIEDETLQPFDDIEPSHQVQDTFVLLKRETDILIEKFKVIHNHDVSKINNALCNMFKLLNEKCIEVEKLNACKEMIAEKCNILETDLTSAIVRIRQCEDQNKEILNESEEQMKQYANLKKEQDDTIQNLRKQIEKLSKSPVKIPIFNIESSPNKVQYSAITQYMPVGNNQHHHVSQDDLTSVTCELQDPMTRPSTADQDLMTRPSTGDTSSNCKQSLIDMENVTITNNIKQTKECYVSISKFLDLESKMKKLEQDVQGLKDGLIPKHKKTENTPAASQQRPSIIKPNKTENNVLCNDNQPSILIIGDEHVRNLKGTLSKKIPYNWNIHVHFDKKANLKTVSDHLMQTADKYDHLVLFAGSNDMFTSSKKVMLASLKNIMEKFKTSKQIHLLLIPERYDDINYNFHIKNVNDQIMEFVKPYQNVIIYNPKQIVDSWDYYDKLFIGRQGKIKICSEIAKKMLSKDKRRGSNTENTSSEQPIKTVNQTPKDKPINHSVKFKDNENSKSYSYQHVANKSMRHRNNYFKGHNKNKQKTFLYHTYETTSRVPRQEDKYIDMMFTIPNNRYRNPNRNKQYVSRSFTNTRRWRNSPNHNARNFY